MRSKNILRVLGGAVLAAPLLCASCAVNNQGPLQPQSVAGPCQIKKFFVQPLTTVQATITVANTGQTCSFVLFNPDLQLTLSAVFMAPQPQHGSATGQVTNGVTQATITYTPQPGYTGPDAFTATVEPNDLGIAFAVTVTPPK